MNLVKVDCYNCHTDQCTVFDTENGYDLVKCSGCGLLYVNPRPDDSDISTAAVMGVHKGSKERYVTGNYVPSKKAAYIRVLKDFFPKGFGKPQATWLDVGCGFGEFMESLRTFAGNSLSVSGVDPNEAKIASARQRGLSVTTENIFDHEGRYDFLSLLNVYSHLPDPVGFFTSLKKNLQPGGELFLQTGNVSHLPSSEIPKPYDLPDHLSFANKEIVTSILERIGFEIIDVRMYRSTVYPKFYEVVPMAKLLVKILIGRGETVRHLFPKNPDIDMYIRCRLKN